MRLLGFSFLLSFACVVQAQSIDPRASDPTSSGGELIHEQAAYRVHYYDLSMAIDPAQRSIAGRNVVHAEVTLPTHAIVLDLDTTFTVTHAVDLLHGEVALTRHGGRLWFDFGQTLQPGEHIQLAVEYAGQPREAPNPPWVGGFTWVDRPDGTYWAAVSCQGEGADIWWPVKDHPSDRADSMRVAFTVPQGHEAISNGRLVGITENDANRTFEWFVSTPISNYVVSVYVGPFVTLEADYVSVTGEPIPFTLHVLPESLAAAAKQLPQFVDHIRFMEEIFGPYPFRADKYAVVEAPYLGMEHQTAIAYGDEWRDNEFGFDWLHLHELAHEWFANLVNVPDWSHMWVHEGFAMYIEALYAERIGGIERYHDYMRGRMLPRIVNRQPVVPQPGLDAQEAYFGRTDATDQDVYFKGAWVLHTLRWLFRAEFGEEPGDVAFFRAMRSITYPDPVLEADRTCAACRFITTTDVKHAFEVQFGRDLDWFFQLYLYQPHLPELETARLGDLMKLRWRTPPGYVFELPIEVAVDGETFVVEMAGGHGTLTVPPGSQVWADPDMWILRELE
jgi:aminopeptidase N